MIRHGERLDNLDYKAMGLTIEEPFDPPLTELGILQAQETGQFLKEHLHQKLQIVPEKVYIESSPYLRALQTAAEAAKILGVEQITINYLASEWMKLDFFSENPMTKLLVRKDKARIEKLIGVKIRDIPKSVDEVFGAEHPTRDEKTFMQVYNAYPEKWFNSLQRCRQLQSGMYWRSRNNKNRKMAVVCFSHGALVKQFVHAINNDSRPEFTEQRAEFCGITAMSVQNKKTRVELTMDSSHISQQKTTEF